MYEAVTRNIRVRVTPNFDTEQSEPGDNYYLWTYTVEISNEGDEPVQLKTRAWRITDGNGHTEEVRGPGVIGQTPVIQPGASFTYTSGCPLRTSQGVMVGSYQMVDGEGRMFDVDIPAFSLDSPYSTRRLN